MKTQLINVMFINISDFFNEQVSVALPWILGKYTCMLTFLKQNNAEQDISLNTNQGYIHIDCSEGIGFYLDKISSLILCWRLWLLDFVK